ICIYALSSHLYFILRYAGRWMEGDTSRMTKFAQVVQDQATIFPTGLIYGNGPGHPTIMVMLSDLSGISVLTLQTYVLPIFGVVIAVLSYIAFLELTDSKKIALLSAFLLSLQPDFLFTTSRGTHEKFTYSMVLLSMFFLSRSFSRRGNVKEFMYYILLFYISILGMISYNFFFAATYIFAVTVAFIIGYLISEIPQVSASLKRLAYTSATSTIFFFSYMFYLYTPSRSLLYTFDTLQEKAGALLLATEHHVTPQYAYIFQTWVSFKAWLILTLFNWVIAPLSFAAWAYLVYKFFWKKQRLSSPMLLLLMFYLAFSIQLLITILADRFGVFYNLELRVFPVLMFFAVPLASMSIIDIISHHRLNERQRKVIKTIFAALILVFVAASLLKATNDPVASNNWMFYTTQEKKSIDWIGANHGGEGVWMDIDERLITVFTHFSDIDTFNKRKFAGPDKAEFYLISNIIEKRASIVRYPMPYVDDLPIVYDSGNVRIYKRG
ncbi:MAG: hypothetical protein ABH874_01390, partial [Methanobacteriota archaeon]